MTSCDIVPANPTAADDLVATPSGVFDYDGDTVTMSYAWETTA